MELKDIKATVSVQEVLERFGADFNSKGQSLCVFHKEKTPSLTLYEENGETKFKCFGCGAQGDIFDAARFRYNCDNKAEQKKYIEDLFGIIPNNGKNLTPVAPSAEKKTTDKYFLKKDFYKGSEAVYEYKQENGETYALKVVWSRDDNGKKIAGQYSLHDKEGGVWINNTKGLKSLPYNIPGLIKAKEENQTVYYTEGEKDAETLIKLGFIATTSRNTSNKKWPKYNTDYFEGLNVVIVPDNDEAGTKRAEEVLNNLLPVANEIKIIKVPTGKDITEWIEAGGTKEQFNQLVKESQAYKKEVSIDYSKPISPNVNNKIEIKISEDIELFTDFWNSKKFIEAFGDDIKYCVLWKKWLIWNGKRWKKDDVKYIQKLAKKTVLNFYTLVPQYENKGERKKFLSHIQRSESNSKIKAMIELSESDIPVLPDELDQDPWLLNCRNGIIDLKTGELKGHNRKSNITKIVDVEYNSNSECPTWLKFLSEIFEGNENLINFLQKAIGYSLTGSTQEQCFFILHGCGQNGKSTFINIINDLLGEYAQQTPAETLMRKKNGSGINNDIARLKGVRFACSVETEENRTFSEVLLKQLSGGDKMAARFLHAEYFDFQPECKIWLATNHKPNIRGTDPAIWRRVKLIPFNVIIPEAKRDFSLPEKLKKELPGILKWAVQGCIKWQKEGLGMPKEIKAAVSEYRNEMDVLGAFFDECCILGNNFNAQSTKLYKSYQKWCEESGEKYMTQRKFSMKLKERGFEKYKSSIGVTRNKYIYSGIGLLIQDTKESDLEQVEQNQKKVEQKKINHSQGLNVIAPECSTSSTIFSNFLSTENIHGGKYQKSGASGAIGAYQYTDDMEAEEVENYGEDFEETPF